MGDCRAISGKGLSSIGFIIARMDRTARKTPAANTHKSTSPRNSAKRAEQHTGITTGLLTRILRLNSFPGI